MRTKRKPNQDGMTLMSVLIGIVIASVSVLACLQLYTSHVLATEEMKAGSSHSRQLSSAYAVLEKQLSTAGYGIVGGDDKSIVVERESITSSFDASISLYWRYIDGATVCKGIRETGEVIDGRKYRVLTLLQSFADCNSVTTPLPNMSWDFEVGVLGHWLVVDELEDYLESNDTLFDFQISNETCSPFRVLGAEEHLMVLISSPSLAELNGLVGVPATSMSVCLLNTVPTS